LYDVSVTPSATPAANLPPSRADGTFFTEPGGSGLMSTVNRGRGLFAAIFVIALLGACTQEQQNRLERGLQNWTGTDGVLDIYAGEKLVMRFIRIDKMTTGIGTQDGGGRAYRFGYGIVDENLNYVPDSGEKRVYFEISDYSTSYVFYENYKD
jgi:hypothetical protein